MGGESWVMSGDGRRLGDVQFKVQDLIILILLVKEISPILLTSRLHKARIQSHFLIAIGLTCFWGYH